MTQVIIFSPTDKKVSHPSLDTWYYSALVHRAVTAVHTLGDGGAADLGHCGHPTEHDSRVKNFGLAFWVITIAANFLAHVVPLQSLSLEDRLTHTGDGVGLFIFNFSLEFCKIRTGIISKRFYILLSEL